EVLAELAEEAESFVREGTDAEIVTLRQVSMRYAGQGWEIPVDLEDGQFDELASELLAAKFTKAYVEFFGRAIDDLAIEAVSWAVRVSSVQDRPDAVGFVESSTSHPSDTPHRQMYDPVVANNTSAAIVQRSDLVPGVGLQGPAVIIEPQTTTVLGSHHHCVMQPDGTLLITRIGEHS
ncbi:MAG: hydantoinase/oxoprolinase family protein, partial [Acidimicrobiales bacterium]